ncbi:MAG: threonylcarbamoyl-AMP synthase [Magnetococcales bacterium]|nr:threonylcarbamoyl-AMP synthase [Magnetococcales bacterium]MBF0148454.1 threonylcarbamoyl-AMP synthase [Magnetococcales bacterium]MBF0172601.1 threonylcarbamoyl-AMP synthase [Magnetococcales bacterium]MBF0346290.1 threonylcarbamoyl-AMP synthase [Magnetococcales bacterium]MBF0629949.1 threonylcarbamoyl-AMP synthase [Magnetococcales bacterium]
MTLFLEIHPTDPQPRLIQQAAQIIKQGGIAVFPTDTTYGLGCSLDNRKGMEKIIRLKQLPPNHQFSILCPDLSEISRYARVGNQTYRTLRKYLPGPYTFVLEATRDVPKTILPKRKTIGLRIPDHPICLHLLQAVGMPLLSTSLRLPGHDGILFHPDEIKELLKGRVDLMVNGGVLPEVPSTVIDLSDDVPQILRKGAGPVEAFL